MNNLCEGACLQNGKYKILDTLGVGGFGITYLAEQKSLGRNVAIKEFFMKEYCERSGMTSCVSVPTEGSRSLVERYRLKFIKEAQIIASLNCENIIRIYDIFEENDTAYYVMELINGGSLKDVIEKNGPLTEREAIAAISQIGDALGYLHTRNTLHLDIKPSNALIGENNKIKLIDFGISKHYSDDGSQTTSTPAGISKGFAPMEQYLQGTVSNFSPATDIYSLGATLLYLLTGAVPPEAADINENGMPDFSDIISPSTYDAICKAMSPRRKDRPQTVSEFISLLSNSPSLIAKNNSISYKNVDSEETTIVKNPPVILHDKKPLLEPISAPKKNLPIGYVIAVGAAILLLLFVLTIRSCGNTDKLNQQEEVINSTIIAPSILLNGLMSTSVSFSPDGGSEKISLKKNFSENWTYSSIPEWCSIQATSDSFTLTAIPNYSGAKREASISFAQKGSSEVLASLKLYQETVKRETIKKINSAETNVNSNNVNSSKQSAQNEESIPFDSVEQKPTFMGGNENTFSSWVNSQLHYPEIARNNGVQGRVLLQFTVDAVGSVVDVTVLRGVDPVLDQEAIRVVKSSPKWTPGYTEGRPVRVTYTFPVIFQLR